MAKGDKAACDVCGKLISVAYLPNHRRAQHGIRGGKTGTIRRTPVEMTTAASPTKVQLEAARNLPTPTIAAEVVPELNHKRKQPGFTVVPFVVLEDNDGGLWLAEKIR